MSDVVSAILSRSFSHPFDESKLFLGDAKRLKVTLLRINIRTTSTELIAF